MRTLQHIALAAALCAVGCSRGNVGTHQLNMTERHPLTRQALDRIAHARLFFGHQSVGYNIVEGIGDILREQPGTTLQIRETHDPTQLTAGVLAHTPIGANGDPISKIRAFAEYMNNGIGKNTDVALFKFCYVDVDATTDIARVFHEYKTAMASLEATYPAVHFVHVTMPLRKVQTGPKALLKHALGKPAGGEVENAKRNQYNRMLLQEFGSDSVFDLASVEAVRSDGSTESFKLAGEEFLALNPNYTPDNGHLNESGRRAAAEELLTVVDRTLQRR